MSEHKRHDAIIIAQIDSQIIIFRLTCDLRGGTDGVWVSPSQSQLPQRARRYKYWYICKNEEKPIRKFFLKRFDFYSVGSIETLPQIQAGFIRTHDKIIGFQYLLDVGVDKVIERIYVLLDQAPHLQTADKAIIRQSTRNKNKWNVTFIPRN